MRRAATIRGLLLAQGGQASLADVYAAFPQVSAKAILKTLAYLEHRGELSADPGGFNYRLREIRSRAGSSGAHARLWRAAHQLTLRGGFTGADLAALAGVTRQSACIWIGALKEFFQPVGRKGNIIVRGMVPSAPRPDKPPVFVWPRKGQAKNLGN